MTTSDKTASKAGSGDAVKVPKEKPQGKSKGQLQTDKNKRLKKMKYSLFIRRVQREIDPEMTLKRETVEMINNMVVDFINELASESIRMADTACREGILERDATAALRLRMPGDLAKHALTEAARAMAIYNEACGKVPKEGDE